MKYFKCLMAMISLWSFAVYSEQGRFTQAPQFSDMPLTIKYVEATTPADIFITVVDRLNKSCGFKLTINEKYIAALDYQLRENSVFNLADFTELVKAKAEFEATIEVYKKQLFEQDNGCNEKVVKQWIESSVEPSIKNSADFIKSQRSLPTAFVKSYSDEFMLKQLKQKVDKYKILPIDEVKKIAKALDSGGYWYTSSSYTSRAPRNLLKALEIRKYIVEVENDLDNLYDLAKTQSQIDFAKGIEIFKQAGKAGHTKAQVRLGQYYLCKNNKKAGMPWLDMAYEQAREEVEDIIGEYEELGKPVTCAF